jgi:D-serine dehydratase
MPTLDQILAETLDASFKGFAPERQPFRVDEAAAADLQLLRGDLPMPVAVLRESALQHNAQWFARFVAESGVSLCPHGKTSLAPQLFDEQLRAGAWGITVANVHQGRIAVEAGALRVLMANQIATLADVRRWSALAGAHPGVRFITLVDSMAQLDILVRGAQGGPRLELLVELGIAGGRTGCRDDEQALDLARAVASNACLILAGVEAYEGLNITGDSVRDAQLVGDWMTRLGDLAQACEQEGLFDVDEVLISAGGSSAYDLMAKTLRPALSRPVRRVLRSGCYLTHDDGMYRRFAASITERGLYASVGEPGLRGALEVWAAVQSRPEPDRVIVTLGRRDIGTDADLPLALHWVRHGDSAPRAAPAHWRVFGHNDQHGYLQVDPADTVAVGDLIGFGVSHPCTTYDKWRLIWGVDDAYRVTRAIRTYF